MTLPDLLRRITEILDDASIPYMLTGSLAVAFYATPRATQDIDLVVEVPTDKLAALVERISDSGLYVSLGAAREAFLREGQFNAIDPETGWKVDFIIRKSRAFSVSEFSRRRPESALGLELPLVSREDLILAKLEWAKKSGSELQLRDVGALFRHGEPDLDHAYLERWIEDLELAELWEEVRRSVDAEP